MSTAKKAFSILQRDLLLFVTNLLTGVTLARSLGPGTMGVWVVLNLIVSYAEMLGRLRVDVAAVFYLGRGKYTAGELMFALNLVAVIASSVVVAAIVLGLDWIAALLPALEMATHRAHVYVILIQVPLLLLYMNYTYMHISREDVASVNTMVLCRALLSAVVIIASLTLTDWGLWSVVGASTAALAVAVLVGYVRLRKTVRASWPIRAGTIPELLRYGLKMYASNIVSHVHTYAGQVLVAAFSGPAQVAYFAIAQQTGQLLNKVTDAMSMLLFPRMSKQSTDSAELLAARAFRIALVVLVPAAAIGMVAAKPAFLLLYGREYLPTLVPFHIILPGMALAAAASLFGSFFQGIGRPDLIAKITLVPLIVQLAVGFALSPRLGIVGVALGFLVGFLALFVAQLWVFMRLATRIQRKDLQPNAADFWFVWKFALSALRPAARAAEHGL